MRTPFALAIPFLFPIAAAAEEKPAAEANAPAPAPAAKDAGGDRLKSLVRDLGADGYGIRKRASETLADEGEKAAPFLEEGLKSDDPEVRWRCRQILRELEGREIRKRAAAVREREEGDEGGDRGPAPPPALRDWSRDMRDWLQDMREWTREFPDVGDFDLGDLPGEGADRGRTQIEIWRDGQRMKYEEGDDGSVKAEVEEEGKKKAYDAKSRKEFVEKFPELAERLGLRGGGGAFHLRMEPFRFGFDRMPPPPRPREFMRPYRTEPRGEEPREALGVVVGPVPGPLAEHLALGEREGLEIREVSPGSLAERLGLQAHDLLLKLNGRTVSDPDDVHAALDATKKGAEVAAEIIRRGERRTLRAGK